MAELEVLTLNPQGILFIPYKQNHVMLLLPILPAKTLFHSPDYKKFIAGFRGIEWNLPLEDTGEGYFQEVVINHERIQLRFPALKIFHEALDLAESVYMVPYCLQEGFPKNEVPGYIFCLKQKGFQYETLATPAASDVSVLDMLQDVIQEVNNDFLDN